ncbi:hypothetical protein H6P81_016150 [Aristolochia fimbriata]|uniref:Aminotransferase-like plant mobile domain-containing protein n=1 Tax=Aristolochia fimbriata TaxID=158543 RepID=A0AAV7E7F5_ARIFI|nr:hypothetical protein H6P81_016150 [Aristolochia fimbriata]
MTRKIRQIQVGVVEFYIFKVVDLVLELAAEAVQLLKWLRLDKLLFTSLVERWRSETNTFHLENGEMTLTLEDVVVLLGLCVNGFTVTGFLFCPDDVPEEVIQQHARTYLLLVGSTIFSDAVGVGMSTYWTSDTPRGTGAAGGPLGSRWNIRRTNATNPCGNLVLYRTELNHQRSYQVTPLEDVQRVTRISHKGRVREDWAKYHHDYIARWEARAKSVVTGSWAHTPKHAPSEYMTWYLLVNRRFVSPPPIEPAMSILHSLPLLEGAIVDGDVSNAGEPSHMVEPTRDRAPRGRRARRWPTFETTTHVEDSDEVPAVPEPTVPDLPPEQTPKPEPDQPEDLYWKAKKGNWCTKA